MARQKFPPRNHEKTKLILKIKVIEENVISWYLLNNYEYN